MVMDTSSFWSGVGGAVVGALVGGFFTLRATKAAYKNQVALSNNAEKRLIKGFLQSVHDEIETVHNRYQESMGAQVEALQDNQPLAFYYPLVSDFFAVYNGNSFLLGRIDDNDLRRQIVKTYTLGKGLIDSFRLNNDLVQKYDYSFQIFQETKNDVHRANAERHYAALVNYAKTLKQAHINVKNEVNTLLRMLHKQGVLNEA